MAELAGPDRQVAQLLSRAPGPDLEAAAAVAGRARQVLRPAGALARLDELAEWLAAWQGTPASGRAPPGRGGVRRRPRGRRHRRQRVPARGDRGHAQGPARGRGHRLRAGPARGRDPGRGRRGGWRAQRRPGPGAGPRPGPVPGLPAGRSGRRGRPRRRPAGVRRDGHRQHHRGRRGHRLLLDRRRGRHRPGHRGRRRGPGPQDGGGLCGSRRVTGMSPLEVLRQAGGAELAAIAGAALEARLAGAAGPRRVRGHRLGGPVGGALPGALDHASRGTVRPSPATPCWSVWASGPCSTWACAWGRAAAPWSPCPCCAWPPPPSPRSPPSPTGAFSGERVPRGGVVPDPGADRDGGAAAGGAAASSPGSRWSAPGSGWPSPPSTPAPAAAAAAAGGVAGRGRRDLPDRGVPRGRAGRHRRRLRGPP